MGDPGPEPEADMQAARRLDEFAARMVPRAVDVTTELERVAAGLFEAFAAVTVTPLLLKGAGLARLLYTPHEHRPYSDIDLLVEPGQWEAAREVLAGLGYRNASEWLGAQDVGSVVHDESWLATRDAEHGETLVELHRWLPGTKAAPEAVWQALSGHAISIEVEGGPVSVLDRAGQALHLALHAAQHGPAFERGIRELALGLERWPHDVWSEAARVAVATGSTDEFAGGLCLVAEGADLAATLGLRPNPRVRWEIANRDRRPRGTDHLEAFAEADGLVGQLRIARRALLPDRAWILAQYPWARRNPLKLAAAYGRHLLAAPGWALRAWSFRRRERRLR